jgi:hypothetical protein
MNAVKIFNISTQHKLTSFFSRPTSSQSNNVLSATIDRTSDVLLTSLSEFEADPATDRRKFALGMLPIRPNISKYKEGPNGTFQERWCSEYE